MALWHGTVAFVCSTFAFLCFGVAFAAHPEHAITYFDGGPTRLFFFDDIPSLIYHDTISMNIYVSHDEGKTWDRADGILPGDAAIFVEHPFNNRVAFVLTDSFTHYRTDDCGKTWVTFSVPDLVSGVSKPLSFHSDPRRWEYVLFQGTKCTQTPWGRHCQDVTYYTQDGFATTPKVLLDDISSCQFAHSSKDFQPDAHDDLIYCNFFVTKKNEDIGNGNNTEGVVTFAIVGKFAVVEVKDLTPGSDSYMVLYVSMDTKQWVKAQFPSKVRLWEGAYSIAESTIHSLAVNVALHDPDPVVTLFSSRTLFVSNSNGTYFVESLKDTNRNMAGYVDYEKIYGVEGVGIANVVANAQDLERRMAAEQLRSVITFNDGRSWAPLLVPGGTCSCSLHLHSVTDMHDYGPVFSSPAPGFVMGVGSIGTTLASYEESNTYISTDAGLTWKMVREGPYQFEFGNSGSIIVIVDDQQPTDSILYSTDMGQTWKTYNIGIQFHVMGLTTVSDSTSQKFLVLGYVMSQSRQPDDGRIAAIYLDFATLGRPKCGPNDKESWYARANSKSECIMGAKQSFTRRKADADCYMGEEFHHPEVHDDKCPCEEHDYECDYNYVRSNGKCVPLGPERIPSTQCTLGTPNEKYMGSSGYRKIPGNKCEGGSRMDEPISKDCSGAEPVEGPIVHQIHSFPGDIVQSEYFKDSKTVLVRLTDRTIWQSSNEGYTWEQKFPEERFLAFYMHTHSNERAYLLTDSKKFYYTTDTGRYWLSSEAPSSPNTFGAQVLRFQPRTEPSTRGIMGRNWQLVEDYVVNCDWARNGELRIDSSQILCESYENKQGSQVFFGRDNALQLVSWTDPYVTKTKLFDHVVGFTQLSEFLIVDEYLPMRDMLNLQVSFDGRTFAPGSFPTGMHPTFHAYTILESSTKSIFLHMTMNEEPTPWGNILKSNFNGTYFVLSLENVNRNIGGFVDFERFAGLEGIAMANIVANPTEAALTGRKALQTRITHDDGGTWKALLPPSVDSLGLKYPCTSVGCALHVHGYTERFKARATYSSPSIAGVVMAVGNVGDSLATYSESDTFLSRDGGFTWEEVHKDAHIWEFGDSGSVIVIVNDKEPTDHVLFTTDEGLTWREFKFTTEKIRVRDIMTVPGDTSRKFMLLGRYPAMAGSVIVHLDFSSLTHRKCLVDAQNPGHDDFELWSPSEERDSLCLFGRQTLYHRRKRDVNCVVGDTSKAPDKVVRNCRWRLGLPEDDDDSPRSGPGMLATLASVPWFLLGLLGNAFKYMSKGYRARRNNGAVSLDEDKQVLLHIEDGK
ncbi:hypothetical protein DFJ58DRAFT_730700 [Suillus subalutaceus]|uniref:uncharacterized protein n=1 Tax=Suillus subalutaceus TaxID=48586 RepID=UPI001B866498|nr:uncharacterized protein DFJ58DRAFT_730700 [Suillus subalutaceus]KAG1845862.1 hypothetical protein DFJ58DRAFT_730700 [Suillus subalutaceus]